MRILVLFLVIIIHGAFFFGLSIIEYPPNNSTTNTVILDIIPAKLPKANQSIEDKDKSNKSSISMSNNNQLDKNIKTPLQVNKKNLIKKTESIPVKKKPGSFKITTQPKTQKVKKSKPLADFVHQSTTKKPTNYKFNDFASVNNLSTNHQYSAQNQMNTKSSEVHLCQYVVLPKYPINARKDMVEGKINVLFSITNQGTFKKINKINFVRIHKDYHQDFTDVIIKALSQYQCQENLAATQLERSFNFKLTNAN